MEIGGADLFISGLIELWKNYILKLTPSRGSLVP